MLNRPGPAWPTLKRFFILDLVRSTLPVLSAKLVYHQPASGAARTHDRTWRRHAIHAGS